MNLGSESHPGLGHHCCHSWGVSEGHFPASVEGGQRRVAGLPGVDLPQCWVSDGGRQELRIFRGLVQTGTFKVSDTCREILSTPRTQSTGLRVPVLTFSLGASCLTFLLVVQNDPSCPPRELLLEIPFGQTFLPFLHCH